MGRPVVHTGWSASMCEDMAPWQSWKTGRRQSNEQLGGSVLLSRQMSNKTRVQQEEWVWCVPETARKPATAKVRDVARERIAQPLGTHKWSEINTPFQNTRKWGEKNRHVLW